MNNKAKWITSESFYNVIPYNNVFHKELDKFKPEYDKDLMNSHILFRKKFNSIENTEKYVINISADDYYRLYINGSFVCSGPAPGYPWHYYYNEIDITKYIHDGENTLAVHTYYQGLINRVWVSGDRRHGLICEVKADGKTFLCSDESFKCKKHSGFGVYDIAVKRHDTLFNEIFDSRSLEIGFEKPDYDDSLWSYAKERKHIDYVLFKQNCPTLDYYDIKPEGLTIAGNKIFIDIGYEIIGYLNISANGKKDDTVVIRYAEELEPDGSLKYELRCVCTYMDKWILSGKNDRYECFDYKGFRYVEIELPDECEIAANSISITVRHSPFTEKAQCNINDSDIQKVWKLCADTIKYGSQECFIDCPTREKGQYLGDVCISSIAYSIITGDCEMMKKSLIDFAESSRICPGLMAVSTSSFMQEIADYSLLFPFATLWYYRLSQDITFLKSISPVIRNMLNYFKKYERDDGLIYKVTEKWNLVDWPKNLRDGYDAKIERPIGDVCHNVINAFYIGAIKCANEIYKLTGEQMTDTQKYEIAYINEFYNKDLSLFTDTHNTCHTALHSNILPLLFNIGINDNNKNKIIKLTKEKGITSCGTYFSYFVLQALKNCGETELVIQMIKDPKAWLNMLSQGATATYEAWGKEQKNNASLFHPWSACPIIILYDMQA